jgi:hypothetical protein
MKTTNQVLLPVTPVGAPEPADPRRRWGAVGVLLSCAVIFAVDIVIPGVVVGLLYGIAVIGAARLGSALWPLVVCGLGTIFHVIAGVFDTAAVDVSISAANRALAILVLWAVGGLLAYNMAKRGAPKRSAWTAISID